MPQHPHRRRKPNSRVAKRHAQRHDRVTAADGRKLRKRRAVDEVRAREAEQDERAVLGWRTLDEESAA